MDVAPSTPGRRATAASSSASRHCPCHAAISGRRRRRRTCGSCPRSSRSRCDAGRGRRRRTSSFATGPEPWSCPSAACGPCATMRSSPRQPRASNASIAAALRRSHVSGSPSSDPPAVAGLGAAQELPRSPPSPPRQRATPAGSRSSSAALLRRAAVVEEPLVDVELDPVGRAARRRAGAGSTRARPRREPERPARTARRARERSRSRSTPSRDELVDPIRLERHDLDRRVAAAMRSPSSSRRSRTTGGRRPPRSGTGRRCHRDLVAQLERALMSPRSARSASPSLATGRAARWMTVRMPGVRSQHQVVA